MDECCTSEWEGDQAAGVSGPDAKLVITVVEAIQAAADARLPIADMARKAIAAVRAADEGQAARTLEDRLAVMLAEVVDAPLLKLQDKPGDRDYALRLGSFNKELAERAALLLEEAGR